MKILDCTLRDGGYYTNWDFDYKLVEQYIRDIEVLPVDYIELGYRNLPKQEYLGEFAYCPTSTLQRIRSLTTKCLAIMLNEKDTEIVNLSELLKPIIGVVDMVRLAVDPKNFDRAISLAQEVKALGFEVAFNTMYMSTWDNVDGFYEKLPKLNDIVDLFCMVDSFGSVTPNSIRDITLKVKQYTNCKLGFHGHDNMSLGLANAIVALENGVDIVDSTILGMGRGAGNLKTELLLTYLNKHHDLNVDFNALSRITGSFEPLLKLHNWGANLPYMLSGANSIPQKEIMAWIQNRVYSFNSIVRALSNKKEGVIDNAKYPIFQQSISDKKVLIIGGGSSVKLHANAIRSFIERNDLVLIFATSRYVKLFVDLPCDKYFVLVGNEGKRLVDNINVETFRDICILPPYPREMGTDVPSKVSNSTYELADVDVIGKYKDSCTTIALQLANNISMNEVYLVGYDGYMGGSLTEKEITLNKENAEIFNIFLQNTERNLISLLPSQYGDLKVESVYTKI